MPLRVLGVDIMDLTRALQRAVRGFALGSEALAASLGISTTSLAHKVSPTYPSAHCSPEETLAICEATGDHGYLHTLCAHLGYVALRAAPSGDEGEMAAMATVVKEFGELVSAAAMGMADGQVTGNELASIEREAAEAVAAINGVVAVMRAMHQRGASAAGVQA